LNERKIIQTDRDGQPLYKPKLDTHQQNADHGPGNKQTALPTKASQAQPEPISIIRDRKTNSSIAHADKYSAIPNNRPEAVYLEFSRQIWTNGWSQPNIGYGFIDHGALSFGLPALRNPT
jgi:hypothetical protein